MKAQFLPLFNSNLSQPQLNSTSTQLNFDSTSQEPKSQINLNSTSTLTSTQYGCDIKATQSCFYLDHNNTLEIPKVNVKGILNQSANSSYVVVQCFLNSEW